MIYTQAFLSAINKAMEFEVGGFWDLNKPGAKEGWVDTKEHRQACGYVNDPNDSGGETKYGIAKNANPSTDITHLDWEGAKAIYYTSYWLNSKCDKMNGRLAALNFDGAIQHGSATAAKFIQRAIGVVDDGVIGPVTLASLATKDPFVICNAVCDQRVKYYNNIVINNPSQQKYLAGWLRRVAEMRAFVTDPNRQF
jgi:lysozyme family protein